MSMIGDGTSKEVDNLLVCPLRPRCRISQSPHSRMSLGMCIVSAFFSGAVFPNATHIATHITVIFNKAIEGDRELIHFGDTRIREERKDNKGEHKYIRVCQLV